MTTKKGNPNTFPKYGETVKFNKKPLFPAMISAKEDCAKSAGEKSLGNTDVNGAKKNVKDIVVFGDGDLFQLLSKASSEKEGWMKSTKAMETPVGCVIQVTTQQRNIDFTYSVAEALTFVPGVKIQSNAAGKKLVLI